MLPNPCNIIPSHCVFLVLKPCRGKKKKVLLVSLTYLLFTTPEEEKNMCSQQHDETVSLCLLSPPFKPETRRPASPFILCFHGSRLEIFTHMIKVTAVFSKAQHAFKCFHRIKPSLSFSPVMYLLLSVSLDR